MQFLHLKSYSLLTDDLERVRLTDLGHRGHLALELSCVPGPHVLELERPAPVPGLDQLVAVLVDKADAADEQDVRVGVADPRDLRKDSGVSHATFRCGAGFFFFRMGARILFSGIFQ